MFKLVIQDDEGKTTVVPLIRDEITIGRKEGNTIRLTERNVSRRHARILRNNGEVQIEDLGSYNGIRVNNARIAERVSLRISDQVQIGDYKLYLKAEGVEQVDDARTMPIERLDAQTATEVMPAVAPTPTSQIPTQPIPATAAAVAPAAARTAVAGTADTDPGGRPVATAAQVAALTQPTGYGKLVVVSSNYAGKEFDLTRPQMIIGRTDENDLVLNHRSISRNHAKITRDPETGRYTISDLQSSNGVRVNGQDYGKVELRRGDTIDLGHVRLRFVEPGEDFVFARDAVIADVVEPGGKRGMMMFVAIALVLALGGAAVYFLVLNKGSKPGPLKGDNGSALVVGPGSNLVASGSDVVGPGSAVVAVAEPDAGNEAAPPPDDEKGRITTECMGYKADKKWTDLNLCADKLVIFDKEGAKQMRATAKQELQNEQSLARIKELVGEKSLVKARKELDSIEKESVYRKDADDAVNQLEQKMTDDARDTATRYAKSDCAKLDSFVRQERTQGIDLKNIKCEVVAARPTGGNPTGGNPTGGNPTGGNPTGGGSATQAACDAEDLKTQGRDLEAKGAHEAALKKFEDSLHCKSDPTTRALAFMAACNGTNVTKAKALYKKLPPDAQNQYAQMCIRRGITKETLDSP